VGRGIGSTRANPDRPRAWTNIRAVLSSPDSCPGRRRASRSSSGTGDTRGSAPVPDCRRCTTSSRSVDAADGLAEALAGDHRVVRRTAARARLRHPVPEAGLPRDLRVTRDQVRIGLQVEAERRADRAVVEVPADLDRPASVVLLCCGRARAARRRLAVVGLGDLFDVQRASRSLCATLARTRRLHSRLRIVARSGLLCERGVVSMVDWIMPW